MRHKVIVIISVGIIVSVISYLTGDGRNVVNNGIITRPEPGENAVNHDVEVMDEEGNVIVSTSINVEARRLKFEELEEYFDEAQTELERDMLLNNQSLTEVRSNLNLMTELCDGIFLVDWYSDEYEVVNYNGIVHNESFSDDEVAEVRLTAVISYGEEKREIKYDVVVRAPIRDEKERLETEVLRNITRALEETREKEQVELPDNTDGVSVTYREKTEKEFPEFMFFSVCAAILVVISEKNKKKKAYEKRIREITYDYSEVVSKLTLLMGAGMTARRAWTKIADDYIKNRDHTGTRIIYEEMYETKCVIESGVPETAAYERFGRKCNTKEYLKLASLLQTNVKKGTKELVLLLEQEAMEAFENRKNLAKQKGEEATTKLLIPMIMMLIIVMIIVMIPAIEGFVI
ncbi:MAG: immunoglobulin-like domain-containing protein [Lachnospira sp.]